MPYAVNSDPDYKTVIFATPTGADGRPLASP